ncbi:hypothetical protein ACFO3O_16610 [Dokdonia ponticola]|uniref:Lipoprotein n=1 Tax=Dokdonia ponticola TaxID=2041041 RepID=A0ABV9HZM3_9FLAO
MILKLLTFVTLGFLLTSCQKEQSAVETSESREMHPWNIKKLSDKATQHLDSTKWDLPLFKQDIETYTAYEEVFQSYPLNKSPFPVAVYDYAVSYVPFTIEHQETLIKGIKVGECEDSDCKKVTDKLTLLVLINDKEAEETTLVDSRNHPYLTAQGTFKTRENTFDWVFSASPDGFSTLLLNMKLFDLRFGETIIIYPQLDKSFFYQQIKDSPNNYENFEDFKKMILNNPKVKTQLTSEKNIK